MESIIKERWVIDPVAGSTQAAIVTVEGYIVAQPMVSSLATHIVAQHNSQIRGENVELPKKFMCWWNSSYHSYDTPSEAELRFIEDVNTGSGYSEEEVEQIHALEVGQSWANHDFGYNSHIITRVE